MSTFRQGSSHRVPVQIQRSEGCEGAHGAGKAGGVEAQEARHGEEGVRIRHADVPAGACLNGTQGGQSVHSRGSTHPILSTQVHEGEARELSEGRREARRPQVLIRSRFRLRHSPMLSNRDFRPVAHRLSSSRVVREDMDSGNVADLFGECGPENP